MCSMHSVPGGTGTRPETGNDVLLPFLASPGIFGGYHWLHLLTRRLQRQMAMDRPVVEPKLGAVPGLLLVHFRRLLAGLATGVCRTGLAVAAGNLGLVRAALECGHRPRDFPARSIVGSAATRRPGAAMSIRRQVSPALLVA